MEPLNLAAAVDRTGSLSAKWNRELITLFCNNPDATPHWVADMDFPAPQAVLDALAAQAKHGVLGYPYFDSIEQVFCEWVASRHQWKVEPSRVVTAPGMLASIAMLIELHSKEGDGIILPMPAYKPFIGIIHDLNRRAIAWPMRYDAHRSRFALEAGTLDELARDGAHPVLLLCSPHNPAGRVFLAEELQEIATIAREHDLMVISDEIHADLTYEGRRHIPFDTLARKNGIRCATCMAPSKTFNIAGEHVSMVVCSDTRMRTALARRQRALHVGPDLLATVTAIAAYQGGAAWLDTMRTHLATQATNIARTLAESGTGLRFVTPEASFIGLIDCTPIMDLVERDAAAHPRLYDPRTSSEGGLLSRFFGQRAGIAMNDGSWFGTPYRNFVRFNFGTTKRAVDHAIEAIIAAVRRLQSTQDAQHREDSRSH